MFMKISPASTSRSIGLAFLLLLTSAVTAKTVALAEVSFSKEQTAVSKTIVSSLENNHYIGKKLSPQLSSRFYDNYLSRLDGSRSVLLQSDLEEFEVYRDSIGERLKNGDLTPGFAIYNRFQQRLIGQLSKIVDDLPSMIAAMDFQRDETLLIDRTELNWPKTEAEAMELWRKRIKSRVISLRLAGKEQDSIVDLLHKRYKNQLHRIEQANAEDAFQLYINSLTELYDPHTNYLSPVSSENFTINMSLSLEGIGAVLQTEDEFTKVVRLVHAGPADKQGELQPADKIVGVGQGVDGEIVDVIGLRLDEVVKKIRGKKGSTVRLEVIPVSAKSDAERKVIAIVRNTVKLEEQSAQKRLIEIPHGDSVKKVGVIDIPTFYIDFEALRRRDPNYKSTTRDVKKLLDELIAEGAEGIIIDLRENGGGSLQEANALTGLFIDSGPTVQIRHSSSRVFREGKRRSTPYYNGPLAVMVNRLSASASEIFAGAIQDYKRGIIVGSQTFGKGTVQVLNKLELGQLKMTESKFYRISGDSTQHRGVIPDITFPTLYDKEKVGESSLEHALLWDRISATKHNRYFDINAIVPELLSKHQQRIKTDPDFVFLKDQLELVEASRKITHISLNEATRQTQQEEEKARALAIENKRRKAKGEELLTSLDEEKETVESELAKEDDNEQDEQPDALLKEAGRILIDALPVFKQERYALLN
jgi:carboxyl-terminal processing protease